MTTVYAPTTTLSDRFEDLHLCTLGAVLEPGTPDYDLAVAPWQAAVAVQPDAVVLAETAQDVVAAVRFAAEHGLSVSVQATGHGAKAGLTGELLVVTRGLDECTVHPEGWARVGAGVKWARVLEAAAPYGLAPLSGSTSDVGVVGYTTGGGNGPMARTYGLAIDRVRAFEVVAGDGELRRVTPTEHPELFFALRGGKGVAGIVTALEFDLVEQPTFYGGALYFDGEDAPLVLRRWREWCAMLPEAATTSVALMNLPPLPMVPPVLAGRLTLAVRFVWTGDPAEGAALLDEVRELAPVLLDGVSVLPYAAVDAVHADPVDPMPTYERALLLSDLPQESLDTLLGLVGPGTASPLLVVEVRQLGGAMAREGAYPSAFCQRGAAYSVLVVGLAPVPGTVPAADAVARALEPWATGGQLPNFSPASDPASMRACYDAPTLERLRDVVAAYDPQGVLTLGRIVRVS